MDAMALPDPKVSGEQMCLRKIEEGDFAGYIALQAHVKSNPRPSYIGKEEWERRIRIQYCCSAGWYWLPGSCDTIEKLVIAADGRVLALGTFSDYLEIEGTIQAAEQQGEKALAAHVRYALAEHERTLNDKLHRRKDS